MANLKTSDESPAGPLSGAELVRLVQGGVNVRATTAQIAALGVGSSIVTQSYSATTTVDLTTYAGIPEIVIDITLTGDITFNLSNGEDGQKITVRVRQDGTGSHIWTSGANLRMSADITSIVLSTAASKLDYLGFRWNGTDSKADILATNMGF